MRTIYKYYKVTFLRCIKSDFAFLMSLTFNDDFVIINKVKNGYL